MKQGTGQAPRTASELEALRAKREELSSQLDEVTARRGRLGQERLNAQARGDQAMVQEYSGTISELGSRMNRLQREQDAADQAIADAVARGVGQRSATETQVFTLPNGQTFGIGRGVAGGAGSMGSLLPPRDLSGLHAEYRRMMAMEAVGFILLGAIVARYVWQRARKSVRLASPGDISGLRTSVEAIAIEVERISENQRYVTKLLTEGAATPLARQVGEHVAEPEGGVQRGMPERR